MKKIIIEHFKADSKKVLLIDGARQIGKTYIIRHIGQKLFQNISDINDFYLQLSMIAGNRMDKKENTLIFLDEIQQYPKLLALLKFLEQDGRFAFIASGSLLGVTLAKTTSIPMGSIRKIRMFPL